jgi:hypothetical protein
MQDDLGRLLGGIPREAAPDIPVERLLQRAAGARRTAVALMAAGILAATGLTVARTREQVEAPVHLDLRVIEIDLPVDEAPAIDDWRRSAEREPEEFDRP